MNWPKQALSPTHTRIPRRTDRAQFSLTTEESMLRPLTPALSSIHRSRARPHTQSLPAVGRSKTQSQYGDCLPSTHSHYGNSSPWHRPDRPPHTVASLARVLRVGAQPSDPDQKRSRSSRWHLRTARVVVSRDSKYLVSFTLADRAAHSCSATTQASFIELLAK